MKLLHNYHDAELSGAAYLRADASALLNFQRASGESARLVFTGVRALRIVDYGLQNVASRFLTSPTYVFSTDEIKAYVSWAHSKHDYNAAVSDDEVKEIEIAVAHGRLTLFVLEPSVGAEIVILCERAQEMDVLGPAAVGTAGASNTSAS